MCIPKQGTVITNHSVRFQSGFDPNRHLGPTQGLHLHVYSDNFQINFSGCLVSIQPEEVLKIAFVIITTLDVPVIVTNFGILTVII